MIERPVVGLRVGRPGKGLASAFATCMLIGCGADGGQRPTDLVSVVDSAGVRIVASHAPQWTPDTAWRLTDGPTVSIGVVDGSSAEQLFDVSDAAFLSDGRILIANAGTSELRMFDPSGRHLETIGGEGEGPGEFLQIRDLEVSAADSIFVWDFRVRRLSVFAPDGSFVRTVQLAPPSDAAFPQFADAFDDGTLLARVPVLVAQEEIVDLSIRGSDAVVMRYAADGTALDTVGSFFGSRSMIKFFDNGGGLSILRVPFEPVTRLATAGTAVLEGDGREFEIRRYEARGSPELIVRRDEIRKPVTASLMESHFDEHYGRFTDRPDYYSSIREAYDAMPMEGNVASFDRIIPASDGTMWVRSTEIPGATAHTWSVFDAEGHWLGEIDTPASLEVYEINSDLVLGKELDELEIEHVVAYGIVRP